MRNAANDLSSPEINLLLVAAAPPPAPQVLCSVKHSCRQRRRRSREHNDFVDLFGRRRDFGLQRGE